MIKIIIIIITYTLVSCSHSEFKKYKMDLSEDSFWKIIEYSAEVSNGDKNLMEKTIIETLSKKELNEIIQFEIELRKLIIKADHYNIMAVQKIIQGWVTDDSYLDYRCWLISLGRKAYYKALNDPETLINKVKNRDIYFEVLIYLSTEAYKIKTGKKEEDETFPRSIAQNHGLEFYYNAPPTKGKEWKEDDLPKLLPKLYKKYWKN